MALKTPMSPKILDRDFGLEETFNRRWAVNLNPQQSLDDVMRPEFFAHVTGKVRGHDKKSGIGDILVVRQVNTGLYAELIITEIGDTFLHCKPLRMVEPEKIDIPDEVPFTTRWNVGLRCHEVLRKMDNAVMAGDFQTRTAAKAWIDNHMKAMAA